MWLIVQVKSGEGKNSHAVKSIHRSIVSQFIEYTSVFAWKLVR